MNLYKIISTYISPFNDFGEYIVTISMHFKRAASFDRSDSLNARRMCVGMFGDSGQEAHGCVYYSMLIIQSIVGP